MLNVLIKLWNLWRKNQKILVIFLIVITIVGLVGLAWINGFFGEKGRQWADAPNVPSAMPPKQANERVDDSPNILSERERISGKDIYERLFMGIPGMHSSDKRKLIISTYLTAHQKVSISQLGTLLDGMYSSDRCVVIEKLGGLIIHDGNEKAISLLTAGMFSSDCARVLKILAISPLEVQTEENRKKNIRNKLRKFYGSARVWSDYSIPKGDLEALQEYELGVNKWVSETAMWIEINLGFAAREVFLNREEGGRTGLFSYEGRFKQLLSDLQRYKAGLEQLIKSDKMWIEPKT